MSKGAVLRNLMIGLNQSKKPFLLVGGGEEREGRLAQRLVGWRTHQIHINRGLLDDNIEILRNEGCASRLKLLSDIVVGGFVPGVAS